MNLDDAVRLSEILLGVAFLQQSSEHLAGAKSEQRLFLPRVLLSGLLMIGIATGWVCLGLLLIALLMLHRFQGPYNGGSDRMSLLILCCVCLAECIPDLHWKETVFGYIAVQLVLSYGIAGWVKLMNPDWRDGTALRDVFLFSAYPVSESTRRWAQQPRLLHLASWAVIVFELLFPLSLISSTALIITLMIAACFHLANACLFGLNRFLWIWLAAYPSLFWLQHRLFS